MTVHQCPKCELKFAIRTVLDDHIRNDHPQFHHEYPVRGVRHWGESGTGERERVSGQHPA